MFCHRRTTALLLIAALVALPAPAFARDVPLAVTGFALGSLDPDVLVRDAHALTTVTVAGVGLNGRGDAFAAPDASMVDLLGSVHDEGLRAELLLSNYSDRLGDFDPRRAHRLLAHPDRIEAVVSALAKVVVDQGWDGVNVDLELVRGDDADGLVTLVEDLQDALPPAALVSIDVSASGSEAAYLARGYDLTGIAAAVDVVVLMAYDEHGPTWSGPGPIGDLAWQRRTLTALLEAVPSAQVDLGVAGYGYTWPRHGTGHTVSDRAARRLARRAGVEPVWHRASGEWSARLPNGTRVWWSDARSYQRRVGLADRRSLHGLAVWRLGSADALP